MEYLLAAFFMVTLPILLIGGLLLFIALIVGNKNASVKACADCGHVGKTKVASRGSCLIAVFLFLFLLIPGFVYAIWCALNGKETCEKCGSESVLPLDSPKGKEIQSRIAVSDHE